MRIGRTFLVMLAACAVIAVGAYMIAESAVAWPKFWGACMIALGLVNIGLEARDWLRR